MFELIPRHPGGSRVEEKSAGEWHLSIPAGPAGVYRGAQLDDYMHLRRSKFIWQPPLTFTIQARISTQTHAGTWGFGFWNDPFSFSLGVQGTARRLPSLPNCAWFFFASPPNHLSFHDDVPGSGMLAGVISSQPVPSLLLAPGTAMLPLMAWDKTVSLPRKLLSKFISEDTEQITSDWTDWHEFSIHLLPNIVDFSLDGEICHHASIAPYGPLGLVIWMDNQFARLMPGEHLQMGTLPNPAETRLEVRSIDIR